MLGRPTWATTRRPWPVARSVSAAISSASSSTPSPVVPAMKTPSRPASANHATCSAKASRATEPSSANGVEIADRNRGAVTRRKWACWRSWRTPSHQTAAMPSTAPGTDSTAVSRSVSSWPGTEPRLMISPKITEPTTAPAKAPTMPAHQRSGRKIVKCQSAIATMIQTSRPISAASRACGCAASCGFGSLAPAARPGRRSPDAGGCGGVSPRARARRPPAGRAVRPAAAAGSGRRGSSSTPRLATMSSNSALETPCDGSLGVVTPVRRPPRGAGGATSTGPPCSAVAYAGT